MSRKKTPDVIKEEVLIASRRRCAICFGLHQDDARKTGQIAHLDRDPNNNNIDNLAFLCLEHHDDYDCKPSQSIRFKPNEVTHYREELYKYLKENLLTQLITEEDIKETWDSLLNGSHKPKNNFKLLADLLERMNSENAKIFSNFCNLLWQTKNGEYVYYISTEETDNYIKSQYNIGFNERRKLHLLGLIDNTHHLSVTLEKTKGILLLYGSKGYRIEAINKDCAFNVVPLTDLGKCLRTYSSFNHDERDFLTLFYTLPENLDICRNYFNQPPHNIVDEIQEQISRKLNKQLHLINDSDYENIKEISTCRENNLEKIHLLKNLEKINVVDGSSNIKYLTSFKKLTSIWFDYGIVPDLSPLEDLPNLKTIVINNAMVNDFKAMHKLNQIETLSYHVRADRIPDIKPLLCLKGLKNLFLGNLTDKTLESLSLFKNLESLSFNFADLDDLSHIQELKNLKRLSFRSTKVSDLSLLKSFSSLESIDAASSKIIDISPLVGCKLLKKIELSCTKVEDITVLRDMDKVENIDLSNTMVSDISALENMRLLKKLQLSGTKIRDISILSRLSNLEVIHLSSTEIMDISPLSTLKSLKVLYLNHTKINNIDALRSLSNLEELHLNGTHINSLSPISELESLYHLDISNTQIDECMINKGFINLKKLSLGTHIKDVSFIKHLEKLEHLTMNGTPITDFNILKDLKSLNTISIDNVPAKNVEALSDIRTLKSISVMSGHGICKKDLLKLRLNNPMLSISMSDLNQGWTQKPGED